MKKAYWVVTYRSVSDQTKLDNYAKLAAPAIVEAGGNILVRGLPSAVLEEGQVERTVVTEFANLDAAMNAYKSDQYKIALDALGDAAVRDIRIIEGTD